MDLTEDEARDKLREAEAWRERLHQLYDANDTEIIVLRLFLGMHPHPEAYEVKTNAGSTIIPGSN